MRHGTYSLERHSGIWSINDDNKQQPLEEESGRSRDTLAGALGFLHGSYSGTLYMRLPNTAPLSKLVTVDLRNKLPFSGWFQVGGSIRLAQRVRSGGKCQIGGPHVTGSAWHSRGDAPGLAPLANLESLSSEQGWEDPCEPHAHTP